MSIKDVVAYCLVVALGIILTAHFTLFWIYGALFICESNSIILAIETAMGVAILAFGLERLLSCSRSRARRQGRNPQISGAGGRNAGERPVSLPGAGHPGDQSSFSATAASTPLPEVATRPFSGDMWCVRSGDRRTVTSTLGERDDASIRMPSPESETSAGTDAVSSATAAWPSLTVCPLAGEWGASSGSRCGQPRTPECAFTPTAVMPAWTVRNPLPALCKVTVTAPPSDESRSGKE
jgi:hypothetical protein